MENGTSSWRQEWLIDPDPLAAAQAFHIPTGYGLNLKVIGCIKLEPGDPPFVATIGTPETRHVTDRLFALGFDECRERINRMQEEARTLWRELGLDLDPSKELAGELPCKLRQWRKLWTVDDGSDGLGLPHLVHASGYAVRYVYTEVDEVGGMGWCATEPAGWDERIAEVRQRTTEQQLARLSQEASILWMELGFFDALPTKVTHPFGPDWRTLWRVQEEKGCQWLTHVSGLAVAPVYGVVDEEGTKAWTLHVKDYELDFDMRREVGERAWQRVHDQGWQLAVEMGYVSPDGEPPAMH